MEQIVIELNLVAGLDLAVVHLPVVRAVSQMEVLPE